MDAPLQKLCGWLPVPALPKPGGRALTVTSIALPLLILLDGTLLILCLRQTAACYWTGVALQGCGLSFLIAAALCAVRSSQAQRFQRYAPFSISHEPQRTRNTQDLENKGDKQHQVSADCAKNDLQQEEMGLAADSGADVLLQEGVSYENVNAGSSVGDGNAAAVDASLPREGSHIDSRHETNVEAQQQVARVPKQPVSKQRQYIHIKCGGKGSNVYTVTYSNTLPKNVSQVLKTIGAALSNPMATFEAPKDSPWPIIELDEEPDEERLVLARQAELVSQAEVLVKEAEKCGQAGPSGWGLGRILRKPTLRKQLADLKRG